VKRCGGERLGCELNDNGKNGSWWPARSILKGLGEARTKGRCRQHPITCAIMDSLVSKTNYYFYFIMFYSPL
jgi:hypothetical protein